LRASIRRTSRKPGVTSRRASKPRAASPTPIHSASGSRGSTGDGRYLPLGQAQWDYLLGANPWGVCFVAGAGVTWPRYPHHQIADLAGIELTGFWDEGPVPLSAFNGQKIKLSRPDPYEAFQSEGAVYHDDKQDYVTNEPTLDANATGLSLTAWHVAPAPTPRLR